MVLLGGGEGDISSKATLPHKNTIYIYWIHITAGYMSSGNMNWIMFQYSTIWKQHTYTIYDTGNTWTIRIF